MLSEGLDKVPAGTGIQITLDSWASDFSSTLFKNVLSQGMQFPVPSATALCGQSQAHSDPREPTITPCQLTVHQHQRPTHAQDHDLWALEVDEQKATVQLLSNLHFKRKSN